MSRSGPSDAEVRAAFEAAADWYLSVLARVPDDAWGQQGLGVWTVKELAAHTARAFVTIETYLAGAVGEVQVPDAVTYFRAVMSDPSVHESVAQRGKAEAANMGDDPAGAIAVIAERVRGIAAATPDDAPISSAAGPLRFADYLMTRVMELTVHTCDLCEAMGLDEQPPVDAAEVTLWLIAALAAGGSDPAQIIRALTGRTGLRAGYTVLA